MTEDDVILLREVSRDVKDIRKAVFGNGRPGLCDRVIIAEQAIKSLVDQHGAGHSGNKIALAAVVVSLVALAVTIVVR